MMECQLCCSLALSGVRKRTLGFGRQGERFRIYTDWLAVGRDLWATIAFKVPSS